MSRTLAAPIAVLLVLGLASTASATFPGANGRLVLQRPVGKQIDLYTIDPNGRGLRRLAAAPVIEEAAAWSPDGRRVAFARSAPGGIWTIGAGGGALQRVTRWKDVASAPAWTPDGRVVYFTTKDFPPPASPEDPPPPSELYSTSADGADPRRLTNDDAIQVDPAVSPADGRIAFVQFQAVAGQPGVFDLGLLSIAADGSGPVTLAPFSAKRDVLNASWSPDGRRLVFEIASASPRGRTGGSGRQSDLAVMDADGSNVRRLTRTTALETNPVWSPDGRLIAFTGDRHRRRGRSERLGRDFELYVMRTDGSHIRRLTRNAVPDLYPDWQAVAR